MSDRKVALVIHGMSEVGTAICRRLHEDGVHVAATWSARQRTPEAWLAAQRDDGYAFTACGVDVADAPACALVVDRLLATHGRLDILVNGAGVDGFPDAARNATTLGDLSRDAWRQAVRRRLDAAFNMSKLAMAPMLEQRWGRIIQLAAEPVWPAPGRRQDVGHAAANAALHGMTKSLALELARHGITVNTIAPGYLQRDAGSVAEASPSGARRDAEADADTDVDADADTGALAAAVLPHIPAGRMGSAADVAGLVAYLASDLAAFVTGAQIAVNGGQHMS